MDMELKTYRAATMQEALALVRQDLGSSAAVLHTREAPASGIFNRLAGRRVVEVTASRQVPVPLRRAQQSQENGPAPATIGATTVKREAPTAERLAMHADMKAQLVQLQRMVEDLCRRNQSEEQKHTSTPLAELERELIETEMPADVAGEFVERVRRKASGEELADLAKLRTRASRLLEQEIPIGPPITATRGRCRTVALVGPTGVGKTTTIAKLAANFRLREKRRVGLITVDTYRIAAVDQLRTYADIIDLPMQVVSTPAEMRAAIERFADMEVVLMDTAGRSPKDDVKIQELRALMTEAAADEVHLVLSSVSSASALLRTAESFATVGPTSLVLTKIDEASHFGALMPLFRESRLPISYLTTGQNVPDDIEPANARRLARLIVPSS